MRKLTRDEMKMIMGGYVPFNIAGPCDDECTTDADCSKNPDGYTKCKGWHLQHTCPDQDEVKFCVAP